MNGVRFPGMAEPSQLQALTAIHPPPPVRSNAQGGHPPHPCRYNGSMRVVALVLVFGCALWAPGLLAQDLGELSVGREPNPLIDQDGFFSIVLPAGFDCEVGPRRANCKSNRGIQAVLQVKV